MAKGKGQRANIKSAMVFIALCALTVDICMAKPPLPAASGQKHDKHAPIEITSDTLDVFQAENRAVFSGHVVAIQAEDRLKGDQMIVYYKNQGEQDKDAKNGKPDAKPETKPVPDSSNPLNAGAIKKIDMKGNVFLSTPEETASGDWGDYEVEEQLVHLNDHVVLTKGPNVLKGDKLVYNLDTGKSVLTSAAGSQQIGADGKPQRVHALFIPESKKPAAPAQPQSPQPPATQPPQPTATQP